MATPQQLREEAAAIAEQGVSELKDYISGLSDIALRTALFDILPGLIQSFGSTAAITAAEWYDEHRTELSIAGSYKSFVPDLRDPGVEALINWAESEAKTTLTQVSLIEGGAFRRIANGSRATIIQNAAKDPKSRGFQRFARVSANGCTFCKMLAGRGAVYRSAQSATFAAHDGCQCAAVPAFTGLPIPVQPYQPSLERATDADRARVRAWLRTH